MSVAPIVLAVKRECSIQVFYLYNDWCDDDFILPASFLKTQPSGNFRHTYAEPSTRLTGTGFTVTSILYRSTPTQVTITVLRAEPVYGSDL